MTTDVKPLPCPWCGGQIVDIGCKRGLFWAECKTRTCEARGPSTVTVDNSIAAWNRGVLESEYNDETGEGSPALQAWLKATEGP